MVDQESLSSAERQRTIDTLCEAFANDELEVEEFERRVESAHRAATHDELRRLLADLPSGQLPMKSGDSTVPARKSMSSSRAVRLHHGEPRLLSFTVGVMGGMNRHGYWVPARRNIAIGFMGGCTLDFREAEFPPGETEVNVLAFWGGVEIIVPPWLRVETSGVGIMGGFEHRQDAPAPDDPDGPVLRVSGLALMGGVEISVRLPGESSREARKRIKEERKSLRLRGKREPMEDEES